MNFTLKIVKQIHIIETNKRVFQEEKKTIRKRKNKCYVQRKEMSENIYYYN